LIEYLASNFGKDRFITKLLKNREIVITPMTNAVGYARNKRNEGRFDVNRDFPYNQHPHKCMKTTAGRTIYKLFSDNLFVTSITFHGGANSISYPWGSFNHMGGYGVGGSKSGAEAPDFRAFRSLGLVM
jgi:hypothetical protein